MLALRPDAGRLDAVRLHERDAALAMAETFSKRCFVLSFAEFFWAGEMAEWPKAAVC